MKKKNYFGNMKIEMENINKVRRASIRLDGLTVIAGENDSGKSTISKMIFSNVKAFAKISGFKDASIGDRIKDPVYRLYKRLSVPLRNPFLSGGSGHYEPFGACADEFIERLCNYGSEFFHEELARIRHWLDCNNELPPRIKALAKEDLTSIDICLSNIDNLAALLQPEIRRIVESEFVNKITSANQNKSSFSIVEGNDVIMSYDVANEVVDNLKIDKSRDFFKDATYVESPLHFQLQPVLDRAQAYIDVDPSRDNLFRRLMVPLHVKDFSEKMSRIDERDLFTSSLVDKIKCNTKGSFVYDDESRRIYFCNEQGRFALNNVASGIKSFGVLELLLRNQAISSDRMLLWDEPENHLHPQWQIYFADILVQLVQSGVSVVICSHSPYFIQAIRHFSYKYNVQRFVSYYMNELTDDGYSVFDEVTDDLNRVFEKLAAPLSQIMDVG